jgi:hypothetical protein
MNVIYKFENCLVNVLETINKYNDTFKDAPDYFGQVIAANESLDAYQEMFRLYPNNDEMLHQLNRDANIYLFTYFDLDIVRNILSNLDCLDVFSEIVKVNYFADDMFSIILKQWAAKNSGSELLNYYVADQLADYHRAESLKFKFIHAKWSDYADKSTFSNSVMNCRDGYDLVDILL